METSRSEVKHFYDDTSVFVTGGTGFLGKILIEKLLRSTCVTKIFILIRTKKGKNEQERFKEMFKHEIFNTIKQKNPNFHERICLISGDCVLPNLGISESNWDLLKANVNVIFHCAATVRFDQHIRTAVYINVRGTIDIIKLAKDAKNLKAFVHVSTAFANCPRDDIDEVIYEPPMSANKILQIVECLTDEQLESATPSIIGKWPNTYSFTKCIAEDVIRTEAAGLPATIIRPSIVTSTYKEPITGYIDSFNGATGVAVGVALGVLRTLPGDPESLADIVPVDYVINIMLASALKASQKKAEMDKDIEVYNFVSSPEAPLNWNEFMRLSYEHGPKAPFSKIMWKPVFILTKQEWLYKIQRLFLHLLPAYLIDFLCVRVGKKPRMIDIYKKVDHLSTLLRFFTTRDWNFGNKKTQQLWNGLNEIDKKIFPFSMKTVDWNEFYETYYLGARLYLLKDPLDTIPYAKRKFFILHCLHYALLSVVLTCVLWLMYIGWSYLLN